jgi:hypothetical protein
LVLILRVAFVIFASMLDPARKAGYMARSGPKKERQAALVDNNDILLAFIRLLVYKLSEESQSLNQWVSRSDIFQKIPSLRKGIRKRYLYVSGRLLSLGALSDKGIPGITHPDTYHKMGNDWRYRLFKSTGLPVMDPEGLQDFRQLNTDLVINSTFRAYSSAHPILARAKSFLCGNPLEGSFYRPPPRPNLDHAPLETSGDIQQLTQSPTDEEVLERLSKKLQNGEYAPNHMSTAEFYTLREPRIINGYQESNTDPETALERDPQLTNVVSLMSVARSHLNRKIRR